MYLNNETIAVINGFLFGVIAFSLFVASKPELVQSVNQLFETEYHYNKQRTVFKNTAQIVEVQEAQDLPEESEKSGQKYIEVIDSCDYEFSGECLRVRSGPGTNFSVLDTLRNGVILKVKDVVENNEGVWYQVEFDEWLRYPERVKGEWYIAADFVRLFEDEGVINASTEELVEGNNKVITVDKSEQKLYAFEGSDMFMELNISTGLDFTPTPNGTFSIFRKTPTRYMQGPLPYLADQQYYDLPGVPWNLYFTEYGAVIHGAYWHDSFGEQYSHGCVNVDISQVEKLYKWADLGTTVIVKP